MKIERQTGNKIQYKDIKDLVNISHLLSDDYEEYVKDLRELKTVIGLFDDEYIIFENTIKDIKLFEFLNEYINNKDNFVLYLRIQKPHFFISLGFSTIDLNITITEYQKLKDYYFDYCYLFNKAYEYKLYDFIKRNLVLDENYPDIDGIVYVDRQSFEIFYFKFDEQENLKKVNIKTKGKFSSTNLQREYIFFKTEVTNLIEYDIFKTLRPISFTAEICDFQLNFLYSGYKDVYKTEYKYTYKPKLKSSDIYNLVKYIINNQEER